MASARFLLRPLWLLSHALVLVLVVAMVNLGFWQLDRLDQRRDRNDVIEAREEQPAVPVEDLVAPASEQAEVDRARFRTVTAAGTYDPAGTVEVRNRTQDGVAGAWLVTPLDLGGARVGVIRGFVGFGADGQVDDPPPPEGEVRVTGPVVDPGKLDGTAPRDLAPLLDGEGTLPVVLRAESSTPPEPGAGEQAAGEPAAGTAGIIRPVPGADLSEGPHLGYAVQWFIFSAIAVIGYPLVLRNVVRRRHVDRGAAADDLDRELDELLRQGG
ncbi:MAG: SURF1 family protein [Acidimicrobiia bacterium]